MRKCVLIILYAGIIALTFGGCATTGGGVKKEKPAKVMKTTLKHCGDGLPLPKGLSFTFAGECTD